MNEFLKAIATGTVAFTVTNVDDIFILMLFFSQGAAVYSRRAIVAGQYLGFTALVLISLVGFLAGLIVPRAYIGFLGLVPIIIGVRAWLNRKKDEEKEQEEKAEVEAKGKKDKGSIISSIFGIAAITFANGGDNIGIYTPLFANTTLPHLLIIIAVFYVLLGVWCLFGCVHRSALSPDYLLDKIRVSLRQQSVC